MTPRRRRRSSLGVLLTVAVTIGGGVARRFYLDNAKEKDAKYPAEWDTRVQPYVDFVENNRGLTFTHPVEVDFLAEAEYLDLFESDDAAPSASYQAAAAQYADLLNAEGLTAGVDEGDASARVAQTASLGFYDFDSKRVFVRGDALTPAVQVVLVHELTHALQAQHFDIQPGGEDDLAVRSVVEADALRIEHEYSDTLAADVREQADAANTQDDETAAELDQIPWALVQQSFAPYDLGPIFLEYVGLHGGDAAVNAIFDDFPTQEELITPSLFGSGSVDQTVDVTAPDGSFVLDPARPWPMFDALVMLDAWLPWLQARTPFDGWAGGSVVTYEQGGSGGPVCFTAAAVFDSEVDASGFASAVSGWAAVAASPAQPVTVGTRVSFESCDRGAGAALPPKPAFSTSEQVILENNLLASADDPSAAAPPDAPSVGEDGVTDLVALNETERHCIVRTMIDDEQFGPLFLQDTFTPQDENLALLRATVARNSCGVFP